MSGSTLNATKYLKPQGLDKDMIYRAEVVNNEDSRGLGRIRARVEGIFEGIPDEHLPWANPEFRHWQGAFNAGAGMSALGAVASTATGAAGGATSLANSATGGAVGQATSAASSATSAANSLNSTAASTANGVGVNAPKASVASSAVPDPAAMTNTDGTPMFGMLGPESPGGSGLAINRSGIFYVPKVGQYIGLKFPSGDPHKPIWTSYTSDEETRLPETEENYPDRVVVKLANGFYTIIDTKTNELFINNPGDMNMTILGDCNQFIVGNQQLKVIESHMTIAPYLLMAPDTVLKDLMPKPVKKIPFESIFGGSKGNRHVHVEGNQTYNIIGHRMTNIGGTDITNVKLFRATNVLIMDMTNSIRIEHNSL